MRERFIPGMEQGVPRIEVNSIFGLRQGRHPRHDIRLARQAFVAYITKPHLAEHDGAHLMAGNTHIHTVERKLRFVRARAEP